MKERRLIDNAGNFVLILLAVLLWLGSSAAQPLEKVRVGMPSLSLSFIAPRVAQAKGFFREEGIDTELIRIATNIGVVAVTTRELDYTTAAGRHSEAR